MTEEQKRERRRSRLRELMEENGWTYAAVAGITASSVGTVNAWLRPEDNKAARTIPEMALRLLECQAVLAGLLDTLRLEIAEPGVYSLEEPESEALRVLYFEPDTEEEE